MLAVQLTAPIVADSAFQLSVYDLQNSYTVGSTDVFVAAGQTTYYAAIGYVQVTAGGSYLLSLDVQIGTVSVATGAGDSAPVQIGALALPSNTFFPTNNDSVPAGYTAVLGEINHGLYAIPIGYGFPANNVTSGVCGHRLGRCDAADRAAGGNQQPVCRLLRRHTRRGGRLRRGIFRQRVHVLPGVLVLCYAAIGIHRGWSLVLDYSRPHLRPAYCGQRRRRRRHAADRSPHSHTPAPPAARPTDRVLPAGLQPHGADGRRPVLPRVQLHLRSSPVRHSVQHVAVSRHTNRRRVLSGLSHRVRRQYLRRVRRAQSRTYLGSAGVRRRVRRDAVPAGWHILRRRELRPRGHYRLRVQCNRHHRVHQQRHRADYVPLPGHRADSCHLPTGAG